MRILTALLVLAASTAIAQSPTNTLFLARSTGKLTLLAGGLGEDRLGGAKIGYIDTGVLLQVVDSLKDLYQVRLSAAHKAYVSKADVKPDTASMVQPFYLTNTCSVRGDTNADYINLSLTEKLPYKSWMEVNPSKIIVVLYGAESNTNWITQLKSVTEVKDVYVNQEEDDVVRLTIELAHKQHWGYTITYNKNLLSIRIRHQPQKLRLKNLVVAIDAGHGGTNQGAISASGRTIEKNQTMRLANEVENYLKSKGVKVIMTRTTDTTINNTDRVAMLQKAMPDVLVSLHFNSSANANIQGVSTYYKHIGYKNLSAALLDRLLQLNLAEFGNIGNFNFTLNAPTDFPNALIEVAFVSNAGDEARIGDPLFQKDVAKKIYRGLKDWLKQAKE